MHENSDLHELTAYGKLFTKVILQKTAEFNILIGLSLPNIKEGGCAKKSLFLRMIG